MPSPEELRRVSDAINNPFEERKPPRVQNYTAARIATLQQTLERQLGPEYISTRPGAGGGKVAYLAAEKAITLANEVFGFNGWSSEIRSSQIDFVDESQSSGRVSLGLSTIVRVTLKDGTFHEDVGYGQISNAKDKAAAFEKAKKEATTDALKRALRNFGNVLGNCLYDKSYLTNVQKIKIKPTRFDPNNLHRHADYAPKQEPAPEPELPALPTSNNPRNQETSPPDDDDEFGSGTLFDEIDIGHYDDTSMDPVPIKEEPRAQPPRPTEQRPGPQNTNQAASKPQPQNPVETAPTRPAPQLSSSGSNAPPNQYNKSWQNGPGPLETKAIQAQAAPARAAAPARTGSPANANSNRPNPNVRQPGPTPPDAEPAQETPGTGEMTTGDGPAVGFVTSRVAEALNRSGQPGTGSPGLQAFNPRAESPSIRRTSGFNHSTSAPVVKEGSGPSASYYNKTPKAAYMNPMADPTRRIGAPGGSGSPLANRAYKPPQSFNKRSAEGDGRPPLADLSNTRADGGAQPDAMDLKRPRLST